MPTSDTTRVNVAGSLQLQAADVIAALAKRHPTADLKTIEEAGHVVALISRLVLSDADTVRLFRSIGDDAVFDIVHTMKASINGQSEPRIRPPPRHAPEISHGSGLGEVVGVAAGRVRLAARVAAMSLEDWAGPVAGPTDLSDREGISPSNLRAWRRAGAVIELCRGRQRPVFPLRQFVQHRPVPRLADLQTLIGDPQSAWLWLVEPGREGVPSWLDMLKEGRVEEVLEAASEDFG